MESTDLDIASLVEAIHLVQQLEQNPLDLAVSTGLCVESFCRDGINLVDEDDSQRVFTRKPEHVAHPACLLLDGAHSRSRTHARTVPVPTPTYAPIPTPTPDPGTDTMISDGAAGTSVWGYPACVRGTRVRTRWTPTRTGIQRARACACGDHARTKA